MHNYIIHHGNGKNKSARQYNYVLTRMTKIKVTDNTKS